MTQGGDAAVVTMLSQFKETIEGKTELLPVYEELADWAKKINAELALVLYEMQERYIQDIE